jgi:small nuclear ribonucleoprotein B and B'
MIGTLIGFDKHLNLILADAEEFRTLKQIKKDDPIREIKRPIGLVILRGDFVLNITAEKSPQLKTEELNV